MSPQAASLSMRCASRHAMTASAGEAKTAISPQSRLPPAAPRSKASWRVDELVEPVALLHGAADRRPRARIAAISRAPSRRIRAASSSLLSYRESETLAFRGKSRPLARSTRASLVTCVPPTGSWAILTFTNTSDAAAGPCGVSPTDPRAVF
jgi:hypothetical protein